MIKRHQEELRMLHQKLDLHTDTSLDHFRQTAMVRICVHALLCELFLFFCSNSFGFCELRLTSLCQSRSAGRRDKAQREERLLERRRRQVELQKNIQVYKRARGLHRKRRKKHSWDMQPRKGMLIDVKPPETLQVKAKYWWTTDGLTTSYFTMKNNSTTS